MPSGSFVDGNILTAAVQPLNINTNSSVLYLLTYPNTMGYSGSIPRELTGLPTQSVGGTVVPTVGQVWPR